MEKPQITQLLKQRVMVLDGAMATMLHKRGFEASEGYEILSLTHPEVIADIHRQYLEAGADIISTNTFCAGMSPTATEICTAAVRIARMEADRYMEEHPERTIFVAGSVGPSKRPDEQIAALVDGGCDLLLLETVYDAAMLERGLTAACKIADQTGRHTPIMVSATIDESTGRIQSGETISTLWKLIARFDDVISFGLNCCSGSANIKPHVADLAAICDRYVSCHPSAGLPDGGGHYPESPAAFAGTIEAMLTDGMLNIIGGCCGTTPDHIRALIACSTSNVNAGGFKNHSTFAT